MYKKLSINKINLLMHITICIIAYSIYLYLEYIGIITNTNVAFGMFVAVYTYLSYSTIINKTKDKNEI